MTTFETDPATQSPTHVDPVTASIIRHGLDAAADQMLVALQRSAFSPIIYEILDAAGAFYDTQFRMLSQMQALPMFTGSLGLCLEKCVERYAEDGGLKEGDVVVVNDPYFTGTHQWDVAVLVPGFHRGELFGYAALKAHQLDVGAKAPFVSDSTDVFQEGIILPGVKLYRGGVRDEDMYRLILANTRLPESAAGDLSAQIGACRTGLVAVAALIERYGRARFDAAVDVILDASEAKMRAALAELLAGRYTSTVVHEHNGLDMVMLPYELAIEVADDGITVDLTDAPDVQPGPVNGPYVGVVSAVRCALMAFAIDDGRANEGYFRPVTIKTRPGSMFHAEKPAPCALASWPLYILIEGINEALAHAAPEKMPAGFDMCVSVICWGEDGKARFWADSYNVVGGAPGSAVSGDGRGPLMPVACSGLLGISWEVWEAKTPMLIESADFAPDSAGAGAHRGSPGLDITAMALLPLDATVIVERSQVPAFALDGGTTGRTNRVEIVQPDGSRLNPIKETGIRVDQGGRIVVHTGGGPGHGAPERRSPEAVRSDLLAGYLTAEGARRQYPHVLGEEVPA